MISSLFLQMQNKVVILWRLTHFPVKTNTFGRIFNQSAKMSSLVKDKAYVDGQWISAKNGATYEGISIRKNYIFYIIRFFYVFYFVN